MPDIDDRLRAGLTALSEAAERRIRPPGADAVPAAARRRQHAMLATAAVLALVLAGAGTAGWWLVRQTTPAARVAAPACLPADATAYLTRGTDAVRTAVQDVLRHSPQVTGYSYETREQAYERFKEQFKNAPDLIGATRLETMPEQWHFTVRCAADYPTVRQRLIDLPGPGVDVTCTCDRHTPGRPTVSGTR